MKDRGYSYSYEKGCAANRWVYSISNPDGQIICSGARLCSEAEMLALMQRQVKRLDQEYGGATRGQARRKHLIVNTRSHTSRPHA